MNFYNEVLNALKSDERFFSDDGQLLRNAVYEAAMQMDAKLIKALYANEETRKHFFTDVDGIYDRDPRRFADATRFDRIG